MLCRPPLIDLFSSSKNAAFQAARGIKFLSFAGNLKNPRREQTVTAGSSLSIKMVSPGQAAPTRPEILGLYRALLRAAREFRDYNIREYTKRRTIDGFRENQNLTDPESISSAYAEGKNQLAIAKRQAVVYSLYAPKVKSIMELENPADLIN